MIYRNNGLPARFLTRIHDNYGDEALELIGETTTYWNQFAVPVIIIAMILILRRYLRKICIQR